MGNFAKRPRRPTPSPLPPILVLALCACEGEAGSPRQHETVLDRIEHFEDVLYTEVPQVPRWCERLGMQSQRIDVGDCELYVEEEGAGPTLVLINGGPGGTHHYFHPWFSRAADFARVIYYDQRGTGLSDWEPGEEGYSVDQAVEDLEAMRQALGAGRWVLLGYSYGGFLAQLYTARYPENVAGLALLGASTGMWAEMEQTRQYDYLSDAERARLREIGEVLRVIRDHRAWSYQEYMHRLLYNNLLNGDWKRQHFHRPSRERVAEIALYEWYHDQALRGPVGSSQRQIDLTGAFENCPVPTLILEGEWDLTWNTDKREILLGNHPNARMVVFENAGHGVYDEDPERFFGELRRFIENLPQASAAEISTYKESVAAWEQNRFARPEYHMRTGWGRRENEELIAAYTRDWLHRFTQPFELLKIGSALYDLEDYPEALLAFQRLEAMAEEREDEDFRALGLIWQGHMLDLLERRAEAIVLYQEVADMGNDETWNQDQFGLEYQISPYAAQRVRSPFQRLENQW